MTRFLKEKIKFYKKATFDKDAYINNYYINKNSDAVVKIKLNEIQDAYSNFSIEGYEELDSSFKEYIEEVIYHIPLKYEVALEIHSSEQDISEQEKLKEKIYNYYGLVLEDKNQDLKINMITLIGLFIVGCGLLLFSYYLSVNNKGQLFVDFINIAGTFSLWEMVDLYLLDRKTKKFQKLNAAQISTAKIMFK